MDYRRLHGIVLNVSYWIVSDGFNGKSPSVNLYENRFSEALALGAYSCEGRTGAKVLTTSPG